LIFIISYLSGAILIAWLLDRLRPSLPIAGGIFLLIGAAVRLMGMRMRMRIREKKEGKKEGI
jgi:F0F1-type ATP synthase assembly protein I